MHHHQQRIPIAHYGIGPIGAEIVRLALEKPWLQIVAAVDTDPEKIGRDLGEVIGLDRQIGVTVKPELDAKATVVCHSTASRLSRVEPELRSLLEAGCHVISTCEELAFPLDAEIRESLQHVARSHGVALLGTGVNPGFVMDKLPLTLSAVCQSVSSIEVVRVVDASQRRELVQRRIGAGLTPKEFDGAAREGRIRHMGFRESLAMVANGMDLELAEVPKEELHPIVANERVVTQFLTVERGNIAGVQQTIRARSTRGVEISLEMRVYVGAPDPYDSIEIKGVPDVSAIIRGGIHGDRAAAAVVVNSIPRIIAARPGLLSMDDISLSFR